MSVLGLTGKMGAGKNECARRLALLAPVVEVSFAAKLKESAAALLGCSIADLERWKNDAEMCIELRSGWGLPTAPSLSIRSFLQRYGTEAHRDVFGLDFWLDAALPIPWVDVTSFGSEPQRAQGGYDDRLYVVTDVRFENEAQRVRELGGHVVRVIGPNEHTGGHASEQDLADVDFTIDNRERGDSFDSLDRQLREVIAGVAA